MIAAAEADNPANRMNDGKCDSAGRFWAGTMAWDERPGAGSLYRLDRDGSVRVMHEGLTVSNGIGWSPDDRTLYFAETRERRVYRYDFDPHTGTASNRRIFVELPEGGGVPDGLTVDADGGVWCALFGRSCINRYWSDGTLDRSIPLPVSRPTSCAFGGRDMRTLFITTARFGLDGEQLAAEPHAGAVLAVDVPETGLVEPRTNRSIVDPAASSLEPDALT
jgi:sugar lactone lactonase YvrE